jgi:hypothetical protein
MLEQEQRGDYRPNQGPPIEEEEKKGEEEEEKKGEYEQLIETRGHVRGLS